jgi:hypothetical protein
MIETEDPFQRCLDILLGINAGSDRGAIHAPVPEDLAERCMSGLSFRADAIAMTISRIKMVFLRLPSKVELQRCHKPRRSATEGITVFHLFRSVSQADAAHGKDGL